MGQLERYRIALIVSSLLALLSLCDSYGQSSSALNLEIDFSSTTLTQFESAAIKDEASSKTIEINSSGQVQVGSVAPAVGVVLSVDGKLGATQFCSSTGSDCFTAAAAAVSGSPWSAITGGINYSQNVGINNASPTHDFVIDANRIFIDTGAGTTKATVYGGVGGRITATDIAGSEYVRLFSGSSAGEDRLETSRNNLYIQTGLAPGQVGVADWTLTSAALNGLQDETPDARFEIVPQGGAACLYVSSDDDFDGDVLTVSNSGFLGVGISNPQASLDVNGYLRLALNGGEPSVCGATNDGTMALTSSYRLCVCKNGTGWVYTTDGVTSCVW